ncbi:hypothetical protein SBOR_1805 [Sclerotinia borealis F-4128]|uniref:Uncharacterized protein n=1 Tax=Sclerotinia borealis (strain F-4128) TaxID=1432307 RepID=W9CPQ2_SCLBF|nr:hypothetical protein SBOR_1805 [Sclerotinia borealis F-4128]
MKLDRGCISGSQLKYCRNRVVWLDADGESFKVSTPDSDEIMKLQDMPIQQEGLEPQSSEILIEEDRPMKQVLGKRKYTGAEEAARLSLGYSKKCVACEEQISGLAFRLSMETLSHSITVNKTTYWKLSKLY